MRATYEPAARARPLHDQPRTATPTTAATCTPQNGSARTLRYVCRTDETSGVMQATWILVFTLPVTHWSGFLSKHDEMREGAHRANTPTRAVCRARGPIGALIDSTESPSTTIEDLACRQQDAAVLVGE